MGSLVQLSRRRPSHGRLNFPSEAETRESSNSLFVLVGVFSAAAIAMSVALVVAASSTWADVTLISVFILVFALVKIALANALFYAMIRFDKDRERDTIEKAKTGAVFRQAKPPLYRRTLGPTKHHAGKAAGRSGAVRLAVLTNNTNPRTPRTR
jgi:hypothetical protein